MGAPHPSFLRSHWTWIVVALRLALLLGTLDLSSLLLDGPEEEAWFASLQTPLQSVLINPVYTLDHVREAQAIRHLSSYRSPSFVQAYASQRIHLPPLMLAFAEFVLNEIPSEWQVDPAVIIGVLVLLLDFSIARLLEQLVYNCLYHPDSLKHEAALTLQHMDPRIRPGLGHIFPVAAGDTKSFVPWASLPLWVAQLYFVNPITVAAGGCHYGCFQSLPVWFLLQALVGASSSSSTHSSAISRNRSAIWIAGNLALATYLDFHCIVFIVPITKWQAHRMSVGVCFDVVSALLQGLSLMLVGGRQYGSIVLATHGHTFQLANMPPNLTTLWYLGMQVFLRFRLYLTIMLAGLPYLLVVPTAVRLYAYPDVLVAIFWFLRVLFRPPGTLYDLNIALCFLLMNPRSLARMRPLPCTVALVGIPIPVLLYMVGYWMWMEPNTGEANYLYFQCLAYGVLCAILFLNFCSASIRRDKALRLTQAKILEQMAVTNKAAVEVAPTDAD